jgi:hypothetical protein
MAVPFLACMVVVAKLYGLPPEVLPSIQAVEGGYPGAISFNRDGSADLGLMQINTRWLPAVAAYTRKQYTIVRGRLIHDPCFSIVIAGAIMRTYLNETHNDLMRAIGDYHSHTKPLNESYQLRVLKAAGMMFQNPLPGYEVSTTVHP